MQRLRINNLRPGQTFTQPLFSLSGQKLLKTGVCLNQSHITALKRFGDIEVVEALNIGELVDAGIIQRFDSNKLALGQRAGRGLLTRQGQVLLDSGQEVEQHHLDAFEAAGSQLYAAGKSAAAVRRERMLIADVLLDEVADEAESLERRVRPQPSVVWLRDESTAPEVPWPGAEELGHVRQGMVQTIRRWQAGVEAGNTSTLAPLTATLDQLMCQLSDYPYRFTQLAMLQPDKDDYLADHALSTAVLAMATGARLAWSAQQVRTLGMAALVCDLGMLLVPQRIRTGADKLNDLDRCRVNRHPAFTLAMLQQVDDVPASVRLTAVQHQERENGSGYPRGLRRGTICDHARVLAVADACAATLEPRHYRPTKLPYVAMEEMVRLASKSAYWKIAARALVQAAGLFPVGSFVMLSDSRVAHVVAANPQHIDRPRVQPLDDAGQPCGPIINLAAAGSVKVTRPHQGV